jgi:hypothetical protein
VKVIPTNLLRTADKGEKQLEAYCIFPWLSSWPSSLPAYHREYVIQVSCSEEQEDEEVNIVQTQLRFSEFYSRFSGADFPLHYAASLMPQRGWWFENYTTNETNIQYRSQQIQRFLHHALIYSGDEILVRRISKSIGDS